MSTIVCARLCVWSTSCRSHPRVLPCVHTFALIPHTCTGRQELERLQLVRTESLGRVVQAIRQDIESLWDESGTESEDQRREEFAEFYTPLDRLQDSAVDVHEAYYNIIRARVEELRPLLSEITRYV